ncbi:MAG: roadblock/LC7 domain-containing protein [Anaerolineales bacterium]|jgi:predicted regulator of Ras-like GTPase activity (Roadblock/LC7/MglB family)
MTDKDSGWEALFNPEDDFDSKVEAGALRGQPQSANVERYLQLPGVRGVIQVSLDGVVLHHNLPGDIQYYTALSATVGSAARQVERILGSGGYEYAVIRLTSDAYSTMVFREGKTFIGLLLSGEIAPTHIVTRLRDLNSGSPE